MVHPVPPDRLQLVQHPGCGAESLDVGPDEPLPPPAPLADQPGPLQHRHVLPHGGELMG